MDPFVEYRQVPLYYLQWNLFAAVSIGQDQRYPARVILSGIISFTLHRIGTLYELQPDHITK